MPPPAIQNHYDLCYSRMDSRLTEVRMPLSLPGVQMSPGSGLSEFQDPETICRARVGPPSIYQHGVLYCSRATCNISHGHIVDTLLQRDGSGNFLFFLARNSHRKICTPSASLTDFLSRRSFLLLVKKKPSNHSTAYYSERAHHFPSYYREKSGQNF